MDSLGILALGNEKPHRVALPWFVGSITIESPTRQYGSTSGITSNSAAAARSEIGLRLPYSAAHAEYRQRCTRANQWEQHTRMTRRNDFETLPLSSRNVAFRLRQYVWLWVGILLLLLAGTGFLVWNKLAPSRRRADRRVPRLADRRQGGRSYRSGPQADRRRGRSDGWPPRGAPIFRSLPRQLESPGTGVCPWLFHAGFAHCHRRRSLRRGCRRTLPLHLWPPVRDR